MTQPSDEHQPGASVAGAADPAPPESRAAQAGELRQEAEREHREAEEEHQEAAGLAAEIELFSAERMIFFTDAVVAIAITLLALGLPLPHGRSNPELLRSIASNKSDYLAFGISFLVIGSYWRLHHRLFRFVARLSGRLMTLNMFWLFLIVVVPFAARVLAGDDAFGVRFGLYALIQVLLALSSLGFIRLLRTDGLLRPSAPPAPPHGQLRLITVAVMFAVSIPIAFFTQYAYLCWIAAPVAVNLTRRVQAQRAPDAGRART